METPASKPNFFHRPAVQSIIGIVLAGLALGAFLYWKSTSSYVSIDASEISAPMIAIGPETGGILAEVYVKPGDIVSPGEALARVGSETLSAKIQGLVIDVKNAPGQVFAAGAPVVTMIDQDQMRVVGKIDENKGLSKIKAGDSATFTLDAFGGMVFTGIVDEVSPTSNQSNVVFSISDKRETKQFDIKVRYDIAAHPEFKNGMSAKIKVYTN